MSSKVLVVDDSQLMNQMIRDILEASGYEARSALGGEEALTMVDSWKPELILLDVMMPDMDGFEVCRRLRQRDDTRNVPIIMVTAKASIADKQEGFEAGADDYITKPFEPTELKLRLSALLKRSSRIHSETTQPDNQLRVLNKYTY
jgi:DNA-binding response OmpR family regulator